jgi:hypothetical protein
VAAQVVRIDDNGVVGIAFRDLAAVRATIRHTTADDPCARLIRAGTPGGEDRDNAPAADFRQAASS